MRILSLAIFLLAIPYPQASAESPSGFGQLFGALVSQIDKQHRKVIQTQQYLAKLGYYDGDADGEYGPQTQTAVAKFQKDRGLAATGELTKAQFKMLREIAHASAGKDDSADDADVEVTDNDRSSNEDVQVVENEPPGGDLSIPVPAQRMPLPPQCREDQRRAHLQLREAVELLRENGFTDQEITHANITTSELLVGRCILVGLDAHRFKMAPDTIAAYRSNLAYNQRVENEKTARERRLADDRQKRDENDVVAQVLNFTVTGKDEGMDNAFWVKDAPCIYRLSGGELTVNFNRLDLNNVSFADREVTDGVSSGISTEVLYEGNVMLSNSTWALLLRTGQRDIERLKRGWALIRDQYCSGIKKAF